MAGEKVIGVRVFDYSGEHTILESNNAVKPGAIARAVQKEYGVGMVEMDLPGDAHPLDPISGQYRTSVVLTVKEGGTEVSCRVDKIGRKKLLGG